MFKYKKKLRQPRASRVYNKYKFRIMLYNSPLEYCKCDKTLLKKFFKYSLNFYRREKDFLLKLNIKNFLNFLFIGDFDRYPGVFQDCTAENIIA